MKKYYEAYDERYRVIHQKGYSWASDRSTPVVLQVLDKYRIAKDDRLLEIGCGEGRDARAVLAAGYDLLATDVSKEAIGYCRRVMPAFADRFQTLDCIAGELAGTYDAIYAVAVLHMLVPDADRQAFYAFIRRHLAENGVALICTMGDGQTERQTDVNVAFEPQQREHPSGTVTVAATSCRMVTFTTFLAELAAAGLAVVERGVTSAMPDFDRLMYAVVKKI